MAALTDEQRRSAREWAEAMDQRGCSCGGNGWSIDENFTCPDHLSPREWDGKRYPGEGLIPCGFCNEGGWDHDPDQPIEPWDVPITVLALLDEHEGAA